MLLGQATDTEIRAAQILGGATMVGLLGSRWFGRRARLVVAGVYVAGVLGFVAYVVF